MTRRILLVAHPRRAEAQHLARDVTARLHAEGIEVALLADEAEAVHLRHSPNIVPADPNDPARGCELVCVLGGDGTILRGAELSRGTNAPLLGVNLGHVGFLAEAERESLDETVDAIVARHYAVEERMTLEVVAAHDGQVIASGWALNEVTVEKAARERMLVLTVEIDGRPLSTWGCDGVVMATPTGSTAYAFSAGGPVVWPDVEAMLVVPISAHALFARPLVVGPQSRLAVEVVADGEGAGVMWCDGARRVELPHGARIDVWRSHTPVRLARLTSSPFTDRLVAKFDLSVQGWRGGARRGSGSNGSSGSTDMGSTDMGSTDMGSTDMGSTDMGSTDMGSTDKGSTDKGSTDKGSTDKGSTDKGTTDKGTADSTDREADSSGTTSSGTTSKSGAP